MADTGAVAAGNGEIYGSGDVSWANPDNVTADDSSYATVTLGPNQTSDNLYTNDYGFTIPAGATIDGILLSVKRLLNFGAGPGPVQDLLVQYKDSIGDNKASATDWSPFEGTVTYGGSTDKWGLSLTYSDVNNAAFGFMISVQETGGGMAQADVNYMTITVYYTEAGGGGASGVQTRRARARRSAILRM